MAQLKRIRIGNDFDIVWTILLNVKGEEVIPDLHLVDNLQLTVIRYGSNTGVNITDYEIVNNIITLHIDHLKIPNIGKYYVVLDYDKSNPLLEDGFQHFRVDAPVFEIVKSSSQADIGYLIDPVSHIYAGVNGIDGVNGVNGIDGIDGVNGIDGIDGLSAYQIAVKYGYNGTEEEWIQSVSVPVTEAVEGLNELKAEFIASELVRNTNETGRIDTESIRVTNESIRQSNETIRIDNELDRVDKESSREASELVRTDNESDRLTAELDRVDEEIIRNNSESSRLTTELDRVDKESIRVINENGRIDNESTRNTSENTRLSNETSRLEVESNRVIAENTRVTNESTRLTNETSRVNAELGRVSQDNTRNDNEVIRKLNEINRIEAESTRQLNENTRINNEIDRNNAEVIRIEAENNRNQSLESINTRLETLESVSGGTTDLTTINTRLTSIESLLIPTLSAIFINDDDLGTTENKVSFNLSYTGLPTQYMISESSTFVGAEWIAFTPNPIFILSTGYGNKTVYIKLKNSIAETSSLNDSIVFTYPITLNSISLNNGVDSLIGLTVPVSFNTSISTPTHYRLAETGSALTESTWISFATEITYTFSTIGSKTLYGQVKNEVGESSVVNDTITLLAPTKVILGFNSNSASTTNTVPDTLTNINGYITNQQTIFTSSSYANKILKDTNGNTLNWYLNLNTTNYYNANSIFTYAGTQTKIFGNSAVSDDTTELSASIYKASYVPYNGFESKGRISFKLPIGSYEFKVLCSTSDPDLNITNETERLSCHYAIFQGNTKLTSQVVGTGIGWTSYMNNTYNNTLSFTITDGSIPIDFGFWSTLKAQLPGVNLIEITKV